MLVAFSFSFLSEVARKYSPSTYRVGQLLPSIVRFFCCLMERNQRKDASVWCGRIKASIVLNICAGLARHRQRPLLALLNSNCKSEVNSRAPYHHHG